MDAVTALALFLVVLAALLFIGGIISAGYFSLKRKPEAMPSFLTQTTTIIGGTLATNLGAVLGLSVAQSDKLNTAGVAALPALAKQLQVGAAYLYVLGLVIAFVCWALIRFSDKPEEVVSTLPDLTKTLLGVVVGVLAIALGISRP